MKIPHRIFRALFTGAVAACLGATASAQEEDDLLGTWDCNVSVEEQEIGATISADFEQTYEADGTYERTGEMNIVITAFQVDTSFILEQAGTWMVDSAVLTETTSEIEFTSTSEMPTQMEQMMLQQMQAEAESTREAIYEIGELTGTTMTLLDEEGGELACEKA